MTWSPEQEQVLITLWNKGVSASQIGARIGVSKGAVCGKARRLSLSFRTSQTHRQSSRIPRRKSPGFTLFARRTGPPSNRRAKAAKASPFDPAGGVFLLPHADDPEYADCMQLELVTVEGCRWPIGYPARYCGAPIKHFELRPYCEFHAARAYRRS